MYVYKYIYIYVYIYMYIYNICIYIYIAQKHIALKPHITFYPCPESKDSLCRIAEPKLI